MSTVPASTPSIPKRRTFTLADGRINFRECLAAAKCFRRQVEQSLRFAMRRPLALSANRADLHEIGLKVRALVTHENERWAAMTPSLRAAATAFDALYADPADDIGREYAVRALAAGRPAFWHASGHCGGAFVGALNANPEDEMFIDSTTTVFEALIAKTISLPTMLDRLAPLNPAGEQLLRNARNAIALRGHRAAA